MITCGSGNGLAEVGSFGIEICNMSPITITTSASSSINSTVPGNIPAPRKTMIPIGGIVGGVLGGTALLAHCAVLCRFGEAPEEAGFKNRGNSAWWSRSTG